MMLSGQDWIMLDVGGRIKGGPFLADHFLYQFDDIDCSLLITTASSDGNPTTLGRTYSIGGDTVVAEIFTNLASVSATSDEPAVDVYFSGSVETDLKEFKRVHPRRLRLEKHTQTVSSFRDVSVSISPVQLPFSKAFVAARRDGANSNVDFQVEGVPYVGSVSGEVLRFWKYVESLTDARAPQDDSNASEALLDTYNVTVIDERSKRPFDAHSDEKWSLSAFRYLADDFTFFSGEAKFYSR